MNPKSDDLSGVVRPSTALRVVSFLLCLLMLLFIGVQYNDPDGLLWMVIYLIPATWALIAAIVPALLRHGLVRLLLALTILGSLALTYYYWPKSSGWWKQDVWWEVETAREGMGMMIITGVLLFVFFVALRMASRDKRSRELAR